MSTIINNFSRQLFRTDLVDKRLDISLLAFRIFLSLSLIYVHGLPKIADFEAEVANIPDPFGFGAYPSAILAVVANIICPIFIIFGFLTRPAILPILAITLTGFFIVHGADPAKVRDVPYMYSLAFLLLFILGPGKYSIDHRIWNK